MCDGPKCREVADRGKNERFPNGWDRIVLHPHGLPPRTGSFHDARCAQAWLDEQLGIGSAK